MPDTQTVPRTWLLTSLAFPSGDHCQCYRHRSRNNKPARCPNREASVGLQDPDQPERGYVKLFCLDCWLTCRNENFSTNPADRKLADQQSRDGLSLMTIGC